jgi:hypothetical protein
MAITRKSKQAEEEQAAEPKKVQRKSKSSFADAFAEAKPGVIVDFPIGTFQCKVSEFKLDGDIAEDGDDQGKLVAIISFEGLEDEAEGKHINSRYSLCDDDGNMQGGVGFLKKDLALFGHEDFSLSDLPDILEQISGEEPECTVRTKKNGEYINAYIQEVGDE